jgi:cyclase
VFILTVGGIRSADDVDTAAGGRGQGRINTAASRPTLLHEASRRFGAQCIVLSVDAHGAEGSSHAVGGSHHARRPRHRRAVDGRRAARAVGVLLNSMPTAPAGFDLRMIAAGARGRRRAGDRVRRGGEGRVSPSPSPQADVLAATVFHFGHFRSPTSSQPARGGVEVR